MIILNLGTLSRCWVVNAVVGVVWREVVGAVEDEVPMLTRKGGNEWVECREAQPSRAMYLGCIVD